MPIFFFWSKKTIPIFFFLEENNYAHDNLQISKFVFIGQSLKNPLGIGYNYQNHLDFSYFHITLGKYKTGVIYSFFFFKGNAKQCPWGHWSK